eukprot:gene49160-biopygen39398
MKLLEYIRTMSQEELSAFAERTGSTVGQIKQVAYGRRASAELAIRIDIASCGDVTCEDIRSDINWAYLRGSDSASQQEAMAA